MSLGEENSVRAEEDETKDNKTRQKMWNKKHTTTATNLKS